MKNKLQTTVTFIDAPFGKIPVKVILEKRRNIRISIGRKFAFLRLPYNIPSNEITKQYSTFQTWVLQQFDSNSRLQFQFFGNQYKTGDKLNIFGRTYSILVTYENRKTNSGSLKDSTIHLKISKNEDKGLLNRSIRTLLSRVVGTDCLDEFSRRVDTLNDLHFQKEVGRIHFKYNQSNWGSCSSKKNLNFSTRLLFAPDDVIDYVIIHELSHLEEMNHSPAFWELVAKAMPDYQKKEAWLKEQGHLCDF